MPVTRHGEGTPAAPEDEGILPPPLGARLVWEHLLEESLPTDPQPEDVWSGLSGKEYGETPLPRESWQEAYGPDGSGTEFPSRAASARGSAPGTADGFVARAVSAAVAIVIAGTAAMYCAVYTGGAEVNGKVAAVGFTLGALLALVQTVVLVAALRHLADIRDALAGRDRPW
jgi:hypothetical protein